MLKRFPKVRELNVNFFNIEITSSCSFIGEERECLLLDEYAAATLATGESEHSEQSDISEHLVQSSSDGESSTDIDAVVKEYKDRITVSQNH